MSVRLLSLMLPLVAGSLAAEPLDFTEYPLSEKISYGTVTTQVQPEKYLKIKAPAAGRVHLRVRDGIHEKGIVWGEIEPDQLKMEREAIELSKELYESKEKPAARLEMADARAGLENRRDELNKNLKMLGEILSEPELAELYLGEEGRDPNGSRSTVEEMRGRLLKQISALDEALLYVGTPDQERMELRLAEIQLKRKEAELERREREARLEMPFTGEFRYLMDLPEDLEKPVEVGSGDEIAEISRYGRLECHMPVNQTAIRQLPVPALSLEFEPSGAGSRLQAEFLRKETREIYGKPELIYVFRFTEEQARTARSLIGGRVSAELMVDLSSEARLVPKLDLVKAAPDDFREKGWRVGVETAFPGWRAIAVGQSDVAVVETGAGDE